MIERPLMARNASGSSSPTHNAWNRKVSPPILEHLDDVRSRIWEWPAKAPSRANPHFVEVHGRCHTSIVATIRRRNVHPFDTLLKCQSDLSLFGILTHRPVGK